jgi:putative nucleotidyltransferase with HDIG domain
VHVQESVVGNETGFIVIVEDETQAAQRLKLALKEQGISAIAVSTPEAAMELLPRRRVDLLLAKVRPDQVQADLPSQARCRSPRTKVVLLLTKPEGWQVEQAISQRAFDVLTCPIDIPQLVEAVREALASDSRRLPARAANAMCNLGQIRQAAIESVQALVQAVEAKDPYTRKHSEHVAHYSVQLARAAGLGALEIESVRTAALLHDVGKIGVPDHILVKAGRLTNEEFQQVQRHPVLGAEILSKISLFRHEAMLVRHHHERWDGKGYPDGLVGDQTPLPARIILLSDCLDAMLMERTYKIAYSVEKALAELARCRGSQFDPDLTDTALQWCRWNHDQLILPGREMPTVLSA